MHHDVREHNSSAVFQNVTIVDWDSDECSGSLNVTVACERGGFVIFGTSPNVTYMTGGNLTHTGDLLGLSSKVNETDRDSSPCGSMDTKQLMSLSFHGELAAVNEALRGLRYKGDNRYIGEYLQSFP